MNHKVNSVQSLYEDAVGLYKTGVAGGENSADGIINSLNQGINVLQHCWEGKDAGVQIENIVTVHNALVDIRNVLAQLATDSSAIASNYRTIQNSNGAGLEPLTKLMTETKTRVADYTDERDTINITPEAESGKANVDNANNAIEGFISTVQSYYDRIMQNWTVGTGRDEAIAAFDSFISKSNTYKQTLSEVSNSIATALKNYNF